MELPMIMVDLLCFILHRAGRNGIASKLQSSYVAQFLRQSPPWLAIFGGTCCCHV